MAANNRDVKLKIGVETDVSGVTELQAELQKTIATTKDLGKAADAAGAELGTEKKALDDKREALQRLRLTTSDADKATDAFKATVKAEQLAILDARNAVRDKAAAYAVANAAVQKSAAVEKELTDQLRAVTVEQKKAGESARTVAGDLAGIGQQLRNIQAAAGAVVGGQLLGGLIGQVSQTADAYANLSARIKLASGDGAAFTSAFQGVFDIAQRTGAQVDAVGGLFNKLSAAGKALNLTQQQTLGLTESITQATTLSGESAESANAAIVQFAQGLSAGVLRGQDLNSVLEQAPRLAKAMADGLGVSTGELKKLGEAGSLTSAQIVAALQGQSAALQAEFNQLPLTVGRSIQNLSTSWTQYVGEVDKAHGASAAIAGVIQTLAHNLDTVANVLFGLGKATAAYQALKLAQTFIGVGTAARVATAEMVAMTAAQTAAGASATGAAAGVGKIGAALASLKSFALVGILTNLKPIGTEIGEQIAKWAGYGKAIENLEIRQRADAAAAREAAQAKAALAQQLQIAADKALGLDKESQALIGTFNKAKEEGKGTAEALGDVARALDLSNTDGIKAAISALDALQQRAQITSVQVHDALDGALKDVDLGKFAVEAQAAFDTGYIGARRLADAVAALGDESLRRAGLSVTELQTGFSEAAAKSINDVDALVKTVDKLGVKGAEVGNAIAKSLGKAIDSATTGKALDEIIQRYRTLGEAGRLSGEQVAAGLEKAREKIDSLTPGVNTLREALHDFGLKSSEELQATADRFGESWKQIKDSTIVALDDQIAAFEKYAAAAKAANKGVEESSITTERAILKMRQASQLPAPDGTTPLQPGQRPQNNSNYGGDQRRQSDGGRNADGSYRSNADSLGVIGPNQDVHSTRYGDGMRPGSNPGTYVGADGLEHNRSDGAASGAFNNVAPIDKAFAVAHGQQPANADIGYLQDAAKQAQDAKAWIDSEMKLSAGVISTQAIQGAQAMVQATQVALDKAQAKARTDAAVEQAASTTHTVNISLPNGTSGSVNMASPADASGLAAILSQLSSAKGVS